MLLEPLKMKLIVYIGVCALLVCQSTGYVIQLEGKVNNNVQDSQSLQDMPVKCLFCEAAMFALETKVLPNVTSEAQLMGLIGSLCDKLTNSSSICSVLALQLGPKLWQFKHLSPAKACGILQVCPNTTDVKGFVSSEGILDGNLTCSVCKDIVGVAKFLIIAEANNIEKLIVTYFCDKLPPAPAKQCESAIHKDLPDILEKYLDPDFLCGLLKVC